MVAGFVHPHVNVKVLNMDGLGTVAITEQRQHSLQVREND